MPRAALLLVALSQVRGSGRRRARAWAGWLGRARVRAAADADAPRAAAAAPPPPPPIVLTLSDAQYVARFEEFVLTVAARAARRRSARSRSAARRAAPFAALGVPCAHPAARDAPAGRGGGSDARQVRRHVPPAAPGFRRRPRWTCWRRSPLALDGRLPGGGDFLVAAHNYGARATSPPQAEINIGFYIAKPARAVLHAFELVHAWLHAKRRHRQPKVFCAFDQKVLHYALFGPSGDDGYMRPKLHRECRMPRRELGQLFDNASAPGGFVRYIPWPRLPHWHDALFEDAVRSPEMLAAHLWRRTGDGAAATRIRIAYEHGLYADAAAPVVARYLLREAAERNASLGVLPPPGR